MIGWTHKLSKAFEIWLLFIDKGRNTLFGSPCVEHRIKNIFLKFNPLIHSHVKRLFYCLFCYYCCGQSLWGNFFGQSLNLNKRNDTSSLIFYDEACSAMLSFHAYYPFNPSPVNMSFMAFFSPTIRDSLWVPPIPGIKPKFNSGRAKYAFSVARIISHMRASSKPPPSALPLTAAMTGFLFL